MAESDFSCGGQTRFVSEVATVQRSSIHKPRYPETAQTKISLSAPDTD